MKSRDTRPELILRDQLHRHGVEFDTHVRDLPGTPDIVITAYQVAIFVNGCHWHRHFGCSFASQSQRASDYWLSRYGYVSSQDCRNSLKLHILGWTALTVWECDLVRHPARVFRQLVDSFNELEKPRRARVASM